MRKFIVFTFACALMGLPLSIAHADDGTLANDANGYYDFIPADQLDSSFASDVRTDNVTPDVAPAPGSHGGGGPGGGGHGGGPHPGPGGPGGPGFPGGGGHGGGHGGGGGFPIPIPVPFPVPHPTNWACYSRDRAGHQYTGASFSQSAARRQAMNSCEQDSNAGHCRLVGCRRY